MRTAEVYLESHRAVLRIHRSLDGQVWIQMHAWSDSVAGFSRVGEAVVISGAGREQLLAALGPP